jgi:hypothetical protein
VVVDESGIAVGERDVPRLLLPRADLGALAWIGDAADASSSTSRGIAVRGRDREGECDDDGDVE